MKSSFMTVEKMFNIIKGGTENVYIKILNKLPAFFITACMYYTLSTTIRSLE